MAAPALASYGLLTRRDPAWVRLAFIGVTLAFLGLFLFLPLLTVF